MENAPDDIGAQLKAQREMLGYSLQDVAQHTRIRKTYLESIEDNQFSDLPGQAYVTGFVKAYARYLDFDSSALLAQLEEVRLNDGPPLLKPISVAKHQSKRFNKSSFLVGWGAFLFGLLAVLVFSGAIYLLIPMFQDENSFKVAPSQVLPEDKPVHLPVQTQAEVTAESIVVPDMSEQGVILPLHNEAQASVVAETKVLEKKALPSVPPGGSLLRMLALSEGSLIIYLDDRKSQLYKLHDGLDLTWNIQEKVKIELAGPGTARFWLAGQELDLGEIESFQLQTDVGD